MNMISGRTETAEQRTAEAEMKETAGMEAEAAVTEETAGTAAVALEEMEEAAAAGTVALEETEEAAAAGTVVLEETAEAAVDVETAGAGDRRGREVRRDALVRKVREVPRGSRDLMDRQVRWGQWVR